MQKLFFDVTTDLVAAVNMVLHEVYSTIIFTTFPLSPECTTLPSVPTSCATGDMDECNQAVLLHSSVTLTGSGVSESLLNYVTFCIFEFYLNHEDHGL